MTVQVSLPNQGISQRKKSIRAFTGLAGSPLARRRGRPRKHANDAAKMRQYRANRVAKRNFERLKPDEDCDSRGMYIAQAPHGKGRLVTGGYGTQKVEQVLAARERDEYGRKVRPKGYGIDGGTAIGRDQGTKNASKAAPRESHIDFARKIAFPANWQLDDKEKERIIHQIVRESIESAEVSTSAEWDAETQTYPLIPGTHRCTVCNAAFDWFGQAAEHFIGRHRRLVQAEIRSMQPKQTRKPTQDFRNGWKSDCKYN